MLLHPEATSTDDGGPRTPYRLIEKRRNDHFNANPSFATRNCLISTLMKRLLVAIGGAALK